MTRQNITVYLTPPQSQERISSSSSSASIPDIGPGVTEMTGALDTIAIHKAAKRAKKQVSYHVSVPMDKSPLGGDTVAYREIPSDTDTTSCFDSDGTYIRSEAQSSDSGAALLSHSKRRGRGGGRRSGSTGRGGGGGTSLNRKLKKARHVIRSHEDFFRCHDNKYWHVARQACFWTSMVAILVCIATAGVLIGLMPRSCDPDTEWWQGGVTLELSPAWPGPSLNLSDLILQVPHYASLGIQALKLRNLYLRAPATNTSEAAWHQCTDEAVLSARLEAELLPELAASLHSRGMQLMVEIPAVEPLAEDGMMSLALIQNVSMAIKSWAEKGVDGIAIIGLEQFAHDTWFNNTAATWRVNFHKYGVSPYTKVLSASYLLAERLQEVQGAGYSGVASFQLLDAEVSLGEAGLGELPGLVARIARWDHAPSQPWIAWSLGMAAAGGEVTEQLLAAQLAVNMLLPGTVSLQVADTQLGRGGQLLAKLATIRRAAVPIFMNGNYKTCHAHCDAGHAEKVDNYRVHLGNNDTLLMLERNFNRRHRYMVISNLAPANTSLETVASLYSSGDVILDTADLSRDVESVKFKEENLPSQQALVIKFPK